MHSREDAGKARIGWIGIGKMGSPMVCAVLAAGYAVSEAAMAARRAGAGLLLGETVLGRQARRDALLKLAINILIGGTSALLGEALAIGQCDGLRLARLLEVICDSAVGSPLLDCKRGLILADDLDPPSRWRRD